MAACIAVDAALRRERRRVEDKMGSSPVFCEQVEGCGIRDS
jgi:hypothetical protein